MNIFPAIDLMKGQCVRLYQGNYRNFTVYETDPVKTAKCFKQQGATSLHIVDLEGAKEGKFVNYDLIIKIKNETGLDIQIGGGIRSLQQIKKILKNGINRIILGSIAVLNPTLVKSWIREMGAQYFVLALDIRMNNLGLPILACHGWEMESDKNLWELLHEYQSMKIQNVLCTDIGRDGTLKGSNIDLYKECVKRYPLINFQASGGVSSLKDLRLLSSIPVKSVVIGKAFYENTFSLKDALNEVKNVN